MPEWYTLPRGFRLLNLRAPGCIAQSNVPRMPLAFALPQVAPPSFATRGRSTEMIAIASLPAVNATSNSVMKLQMPR